MKRVSYFKLASQEPVARQRFVLASESQPVAPRSNLHIRTWVGGRCKSTQAIKITVDSFYKNGNFNPREYEKWRLSILQRVKEKMDVSLTNDQRRSIRQELRQRTERELAYLRF